VTPLTVVALIFGSMLVLMALRIPIAIAMFGAGCLGYVLLAGWSPLAHFLSNQAFARFASYDLSVIPLFLLMGHLATQSGISKSLFELASGLMARFRGGLAMAAVLASAAFGSVCGSSVATTATIAAVALPEMRRQGYSGRLATGTLAAGGTLGILIPPSVPLVIYAILAEQNIAKLFAAALVPGIVAMLGYLIAIAVFVRLYPQHAPAQAATASTGWHGFAGVAPILFIFLLVFGGIYAGIFTPTEGAAVGVAGTLIVAIMQRAMSTAKLLQCFYATAQGSAMLFLIFLGADLMNAALALTQLPNQLAGWVLGWGLPALGVVACILLFYIALGAIMDELSMLLLTIPIFFPIVNGLELGMSPEHVAIWFGILVLMTVGFGMLAPPVGLNVYVVNQMAKDVSVADSYRGVLPFLITDALRMVLLFMFPGLSLWLVGFVR
jgi:tripartite ATP-independent transporter DctM subunit